MCKIDFKEIKRYVVRHKHQNWQLNYQIEKKNTYTTNRIKTI